jgi:putative addiction module component (TIGR02574 family)
MSPSTSSLLESVLSLPEPDRLAIAEALLFSLPEDSPDLDEEAFIKEMQRRSEEMKNDPSAGIPWSELRKQR